MIYGPRDAVNRWWETSAADAAILREGLGVAVKGFAMTRQCFWPACLPRGLEGFGLSEALGCSDLEPMRRSSWL